MRHGHLIIYIIFLSFCTCPVVAQQQLFKPYTSNDGLAANLVLRIFQDEKAFLWVATYEGLSKYDGHQFTNYGKRNGLSADVINDFYEPGNGKLYIATNEKATDIMNEKEQIQKAAFSGITINRFIKTADKKIIVLTDYNGLYELKDGQLFKPAQACSSCNYYNMIELNDSLFLLQSDSSVQILDKKYELYAELKQSYPAFADYKIYKDTKNRVWAGTVEGLKLFSSVPQKGASITYGEIPKPFNIPFLRQTLIREIFEDAGHTIWIGTVAGLVKIDTTGKLQVFSEKNGLPSRDIYHIFQDIEKNIWVGTGQGLAKLITKTGISIYTSGNELSPTGQNRVIPAGSREILALTPEGLQLFDKTTGRLITAIPEKKNYSGYVNNSAFPLLTDNNKLLKFDTLNRRPGIAFSFAKSLPFISAVAKGTDDIFFIANNASHNKISIYTDKLVQEDSNFHALIYDMLVDKKGDLWIGTRTDGVYRAKYNYVNGAFVLSSSQHFLPGIAIRCLYEDSRGNIWAGTRYDGVFRLDAAKEYSPANFNQKSGLSSNWIKAVTESEDGNIWVGSYQGLDKLIFTGTLFRVFNFSRVHNFFANINSMAAGSNQLVWLGTSSGLTVIRDGELEKTPPGPVYITSASVADTVYKINTTYSTLQEELNYKQNRIVFTFSSPGFINEKKILYSYRLKGSNNDTWSPLSNEHTVSYASLQPGKYVFEVRSQGWNGMWGESGRFEFTIKPPFWQTGWFIAASLILLTGAIFWAVRKRISVIRHEAEMKQKITETEMMAFRAQMNPHFIFNSLNAIDNLIQTNQKDRATTYLARFAKLIRNVLDSSKNNVVPFQKDFESLQLYLQMEQFRSNNKFEYELKADNELLQSDYKVPPLIVQPFVENAIHHGLLNKETGNRKLTVSAALQNDCIKYTVTDNGVGRAKAQQLKELNKPEHQSYGIDITTERIELYNKNGKNNYVTITDLLENNEPAGTRVEIKIKVFENT